MKHVLYPIFIIAVLLVESSMAGLSYSEKEVHRFHYDVKGEINIKPDRAVFPITVTIESSSYQEALNKSNLLIKKLKNNIKKLNNSSFSIAPSDFFKKKEYDKSLSSISFFNNDDEQIKARSVIFLTIDFAKADDFKTRSNHIAKMLDFINTFKKEYKSKKHTTIYQESNFYEVKDVEKYREQIIVSIYQKAKVMVNIIGKHENIIPRINEVYFDQYIKEDIINFNRASLSINAKIEYTFKDRKE